MTSQHDKAKRWYPRQFSIMHLLAVISITGIMFAMMRLSGLLGVIWFTIVGSAYGLRFTWQHNRHGATESVAGGSAGGIAGSLVVLVYAYTSPERWEDEGVGFFGCLVYFVPIAIYAGAVVGVLLWAAGTASRVMINPYLSMKNHKAQ